MKKIYQSPVTRLIQIRQNQMICSSLPRLKDEGYNSASESLSRNSSRDEWDDEEDWDY